MVAAGHQQFDRGDMLALTFDSATDEARWICDRIGRLRGMPFTDEPGGAAARAVLVGLRGAVPQGEQGRRAAGRGAEAAEIPYVIKGLTRLFDAPEVQACVACFQYIMQRGHAPMT